jgi:hypothetical protein
MKQSLARFVEIVLFGLLLTAFSPAWSATFGRTTEGTLASAGLRADFKRGSKFVLTEKGTFQDACAYLDAKGSGTGEQFVRLALYRDRNGAPAELVLETMWSAFIPSQGAAQWICFGSAAVPLDPGTYWAMIHSGGDPGIVRYFYDGPANWYGNADVYADGSSDVFGPGGTGEGTISIRVNYTPDSQLHFAGRRTVGSKASSGMSSSFKRGSSFQLTEKAILGSFSAYIDGRGGASGTQSLHLAIYDDVNGEPSALVAQGEVSLWTPIAGRAGRWVTTGPQERVPLMPGRYWIVLVTKGTAGVMRYYLDGTGNWRGNANTNANADPNTGAVADEIFGTASTGDGTASAYITYTPANIVQYKLGRTTAGSIPSKGLSANFIRGSRGALPEPLTTDLFMTAMWAYVDGKGGATGSQKLRVALYDEDEPLVPIGRVAQSAEVTIPAGTPPGWVRFAVPYTQLFWYKNYVMMMLSGDTAGVARNYAGNEPNAWFGLAAPYANGAPGLIWLDPFEVPQPPPQRGNGQVSIYAEYQTTPSNN